MDRKKRISLLLNYFKKDIDNRIFKIIVKKTNKDFKEFIEPLIDRYSPEIRDEKFYKKLILGSTELYALGCYLIIYISGNNYSFLRKISKKLKLNINLFLFLLPFFQIRKKTRQKIMYASAFGVLIDHVFDIELKEVKPKKRSEIIKNSFFKETKGQGKLSLLSYFSKHLDRKSIIYLKKWCDAEAKGLEKNQSIREFGILGAIKLLYSTIEKDVDKTNYKLMIEIAYFVQMLDDYIDVEDDLEQNKVTPVIEGEWDINNVIKKFEQCVSLALISSKKNNISDTYFKLIEENLMYFSYNLVKKMANKAAN
jgi:hypothetical protein